ncbi:MAG: hypothetical protein K6C05_03015 [Anaerovibrio sp.]|uniref:hypothetical protein n=1 Tax=Anaerovibrio sp. TaxID=1872532 RepID=UPI0025D7EE6B|nr:hypothetical protein [Anaerovibrio sp.]MCR5175802.1 hypothetical protein [Anaerovibrio sp.]
MMNRVLKLFPVLVAVWLCLFSTGFAQVKPDGVVTLRMNGMAQDGQEKTAEEDAKKRAVFKVFSHDTRAENDPESIFSKIMENYNDYVEGCIVLKKNSSGNQIMVIAEVMVNRTGLQRDFYRGVAGRQTANDDMTASIIMRAMGTTNNKAFSEKLMEAFNHRFELQGFQTEVDDDALAAARYSYTTGDYSSFDNGIRELIENNTIMVNFAIVGEAEVLEVTANPVGNGYLGRSIVRIHAYDCMKKQIIGSFQETYEILAVTPDEAERLVLAKAGLDAAEKMANDTLKYWRNKR